VARPQSNIYSPEVDTSDFEAFEASENRMLRRIFAPKGDEMLGGRRKFHDEELHSQI
jgi:hypothetical protein